ncbi:hypothetical protein CDD80_6189 [Ophiocordyceps camponoti-rufipedis]|uniref:Protein-arginine deiminase C-terminal domain-containing protein n=1 Tax=Ophiocordyceps camponoti-rufipedis TaxID=2004952 RepID=A0A2C5YL75_9HYPO|nr:hypothetical protein CDD80_6189 [Ophiocordyceps camponoti-rufipedis]
MAALFRAWLLAAIVQASGPRAEIRADSNRDGLVDAHDAQQKSGAIFLPNIGDKTRRCRSQDARGNALGDDELASCNDASGQKLLAPEFAAPLRTLPLDVSDQGSARIYSLPEAAARRVRIFVLDDKQHPDQSSSWRLVDPQLSFNATQLRSGLVLALDGREPVMKLGVWNGSVTVHFDVRDGQHRTSDAVSLTMAPILTHHHLQTVDTLISVPIASDPFYHQLDQARAASGIKKPLFPITGTDDIWAQDFMEPAYASMPGPNGPISLRVILRSAQSSRPAGRFVFEQLRGPGLGGLQTSSALGSGFGERHINSMGNLETIPPYRSRQGVEYASGRIIMGKHYNDLPAQSMLDFLHAQRLQSPLFLEAGWLLVGHIDEFVQFVPYANDLGFTIAIADTRCVLSLLQKLEKDGHGNIQAVSYKPVNKSLNAEEAIDAGIGLTVSDLIHNQTFHEDNAFAQRHIDANLKTLLSEIPLHPRDVIRVPTLFHALDYIYPASDDGTPPLKDPPPPGEKQATSFYPEGLNGVVVGRNYISPRIYGPVVDGVDVLARATEEAYARAGMRLHYVDDFLSHHLSSGEVHCGSNTLRRMDGWWKGR